MFYGISNDFPEVTFYLQANKILVGFCNDLGGRIRYGALKLLFPEKGTRDN